MKNKSLQFRVGLLVCGTLTVFVGLVLFIVGSAFDSVSARYYILFEENVKGMVVGSKVNFQGVPIGSVSDIAFRDGKTSVEITVDPRKADIQDVTRARLDRLLVTGQVTVELEGYERDARSIQPGALIEPKDDPLNSLKSSLPEIVHNLEDTLAHTDRLLLSANQLLGPENRQHVSNILANLDAATQRIPSEMTALMDDSRVALAEFTKAAEAGRDLIDGPETQATLAAARQAMEKLVEVEQRLDTLAREATAMVATMRLPLQSTILAARESMTELRGLARLLRMAPASLLFGEEQAEIHMPATPAGGQ